MLKSGNSAFFSAGTKLSGLIPSVIRASKRNFKELIT